MTGKDIVVIGALAAGAFLLLGRGGVFGGVEGGNGKKATAITGITPPNDGGGGTTNPTTPAPPVTPAVTPAGTKKEASIQYNLTPISGSLLDTLGSGQGAIKYIPSAGFVTPFAPLTPYQQLLSVSKGAGGISTPMKKDIVAVPYLGFNAGVFGTRSNAGFTPISTPTKTTPTTTTNKTINSPVLNTAPKYSGKKYGGWGG